MHAEGFGLIRSGQHHPAAHGNRFAAQRWIEQLFHRRIEGVEVGMQDCPRRHGLPFLSDVLYLFHSYYMQRSTIASPTPRYHRSKRQASDLAEISVPADALSK